MYQGSDPKLPHQALVIRPTGSDESTVDETEAWVQVRHGSDHLGLAETALDDVDTLVEDSGSQTTHDIETTLVSAGTVDWQEATTLHTLDSGSFSIAGAGMSLGQSVTEDSTFSTVTVDPAEPVSVTFTGGPLMTETRTLTPLLSAAL